MNKRKHRRTGFNRDVILSSVDGKTAVTRAKNISTSGICLYGEAPRMAGELLRLKFDLIQNSQKREINVAGEVKYVELDEHGYSFGVRFL
jgi:hypothetical protein